MREELRYLLQNVFDCKIKKKYVDPAIDILAFKHKLMTNYCLFNVYGPSNDNQAGRTIS